MEKGWDQITRDLGNGLPVLRQPRQGLRLDDEAESPKLLKLLITPVSCALVEVKDGRLLRLSCFGSRSTSCRRQMTFTDHDDDNDMV